MNAVQRAAERVKQRIAGRNMARELFGLIEGDTADAVYMKALVAEMESLAGLTREPEHTVKELEPIVRLGATVMPFGEHAHKRFDDVPLNYLDWLCREQESFYKTLRAYLKHPELEQRRPHE